MSPTNKRLLTKQQFFTLTYSAISPEVYIRYVITNPTSVNSQKLFYFFL